MSYYSAYLFLLVLLIVSCDTSTPSQEVINRIQKEGDTYCKEIRENDAVHEYIDRIIADDLVMIKNAHILRQCTDASASLSIRFLLSRALIDHPKEVLSHVPQHFPLKEICDIPYIEPEQEVINTHVLEAIKTLEALPEKDATCAACLEEYMKLKERFVR